MPEEAWARYMAWNAALAARWFSEETADGPAYLDVEPALLDQVARELGEGDGGPQALASAVRDSLGASASSAFNAHSEALSRWRSSLREAARRHELLDEAPPVTALLGSFTVAAYSMGSDASTRRTRTCPACLTT